MASTHIAELLAGLRDDNGNPLENGFVYFYAPGTTNTCHVYQCSSPCQPHCVPLTLDAYGRKLAYADKTLKMVVKENCGTDCGSTVFTADRLNYVAPTSAGFSAGGDCSAAGRSIGNTCAYNLSIKTANKCYVDVGSTGRVSIDNQAVPTHTKVNAFSVYDATTCTVSKLFHKATGNNVATAYDLYSNGGNAAFRNWRMSANEECGRLSWKVSTATGTAPSCSVVHITSLGQLRIGGSDTRFSNGWCDTLHVKTCVIPASIQLQLNNAAAAGAGVARVRFGAVRWASAGCLDEGGRIVSRKEVSNACSRYGIAFEYAGAGNCLCEGMRLASSGNFGVGTALPCYKLESSAEVGMGERATRPSRPCEGKAVFWVSDGTCLGDCGDLIYAVTQGGCTRYNTVGDFSAACGW